VVFDVSKNPKSYGPDGGYRVFVGKDASRALAKSSLKPEDAVPEYEDLDAKDLKVLDDWYSYFSQRYNIVGKLVN
jgi:membrane-associated progesterone receptor component